jgi:alpha-tubulin suppressor-like RCC1 family protein
LGNENKKDQKIPIEVLIKDENKANKIICGPNHSLILTTNGEIYAFGQNYYE